MTKYELSVYSNLVFIIMHRVQGKGKTIPKQALTGPNSCRRSRFQDF